MSKEKEKYKWLWLFLGVFGLALMILSETYCTKTAINETKSQITPDYDCVADGTCTKACTPPTQEEQLINNVLLISEYKEVCDKYETIEHSEIIDVPFDRQCCTDMCFDLLLGCNDLCEEKYNEDSFRWSYTDCSYDCNVEADDCDYFCEDYDIFYYNQGFAERVLSHGCGTEPFIKYWNETVCTQYKLIREVKRE